MLQAHVRALGPQQGIEVLTNFLISRSLVDDAMKLVGVGHECHRVR